MSTVPCSPVHREHQIDHSITSAIDRRSLKAAKAVVVAHPKKPTSISTQTPAWPAKTAPVTVKPLGKSLAKPLLKPAAKLAAAKPVPVVRSVPKPKPAKSVPVIQITSKTVSTKSKTAPNKPIAAAVKAKPVAPKRAATKPKIQSEYEEITNSPRNRSLVNEAMLNFTTTRDIQTTDSHQYGSFDSDRPINHRRPSVTSDSSSSSDSDSDTSYDSSTSSSVAVTPRVDILQKIEIVPTEVIRQQQDIEAQMAAVKQRIKERQARTLSQNDLRSQLVANSVNQVCSTIVAKNSDQVSSNQSVRDCEAELAALRAKAKLFHMTQPTQRPMHPVINGQPPRAAYHSAWWPDNTSQAERDHSAQQRRNMAHTRMY